MYVSVRAVKELRIEMIFKLYGKFYEIRVLTCSISDQGHNGASRMRFYLAMFWKGDVIEIYSIKVMYDKVTSYIKKHVSTKPSDYFVATTYDVALEAADVARARKKRCRTAPCSCKFLLCYFWSSLQQVCYFVCSLAIALHVLTLE